MFTAVAIALDILSLLIWVFMLVYDYKHPRALTNEDMKHEIRFLYLIIITFIVLDITRLICMVI